jgi:uncharacterized protein (TIGR00369 family)
MTERSRTITWTDPAETAAHARSLPGLAALRAVLAGELAQPPIARLFGFTMTRVEDGLVEMQMPIGEHLYNPIGLVHGGTAATLLDSVMGCAVQSTLPQGTGYATLELKINYLKPITLATGHIIATGRLVSGGRRAAFADGEIRDAAGRLLATGTTTCAIWQLPPEGAKP